MVDEGRRGQISKTRRGHGQAVQCLRATAGTSYQRQGKPRGEYRRLWWHSARPGCVQEDRRVQERRKDRGSHTTAALLSWICPWMAGTAARGTHSPRPFERCSCACEVAGDRAAGQCSRIL